MHNIDAVIKKFSGNFTVFLFHYDNRTSDWDAYEWSKQAIHISVQKQTKWWFTKRFLHPDIVAAYEYIFIWDEDLGVEHFKAEEYIKLVKKHGLEISQPGLEPNSGLTWQMIKRRGDREVNKETHEKPCWCPRLVNFNLTQELSEHESKLNDIQTKLTATLSDRDEATDQLYASQKAVEDLKLQLDSDSQRLQSQVFTR